MSLHKFKNVVQTNAVTKKIMYYAINRILKLNWRHVTTLQKTCHADADIYLRPLKKTHLLKKLTAKHVDLVMFCLLYARCTQLLDDTINIAATSTLQQQVRNNFSVVLRINILVCVMSIITWSYHILSKLSSLGWLRCMNKDRVTSCHQSLPWRNSS